MRHGAGRGMRSEMRTYAVCDRRGAGCLPSVAPSLSLSRTTLESPSNCWASLGTSRAFLLGDARASEQRSREADTWGLAGRGQGRRFLRGRPGISCFLIIPALVPSFSSRGSLEKVLPTCVSVSTFKPRDGYLYAQQLSTEALGQMYTCETHMSTR